MKEGLFPVDRVRKVFMDEEAVNVALYSGVMNTWQKEKGSPCKGQENKGIKLRTQRQSTKQEQAFSLADLSQF